MRAYTSPQVTDFGDVTAITAASVSTTETDTQITANGTIITTLPGPDSEISCIDTTPRDGICDVDQQNP